MNIIKYIRTLAFVALTGLFAGCADYLDVSAELSENLDQEKVFSTAKYFKQWYAEIYQTCPNYSETGLDVQNSNGVVNSWAIYSGEIVCAHPNVLKFGQNTFTPSSTSHNRWWNCYKQIRQAMILLDMAPETLGDPNNPNNYIDQEDMRRYKADAIYLMAYNYFLLFELYGPTPIIESIADPNAGDTDYARASVDEMVQHIDGLLESLISGEYSDALPETIKTGTGVDYDHATADNYNLNEILRPTKAAALALRARLWVYAASPLFNGGYTEALQLVDTEGKRLFPDYDAGKWTTAKMHLEALFSFADRHGMGLYKAKPETDGTVDPNKSIYELFQYYNDEILWANGNNDYNNSITGNKMEQRTAPGGLESGTGNVGFYQNIIDLFFTRNGLDKSEDPEYNETGFTDYANVCNEDKHVDKHIFNMYVNREPRFYADVTYEGKSWHKQLSKFPDWGTYFSKGGGSYRDNTMHARTGYLLYKFNNRTILNEGTNTKQWGRPWIYFRLGDFYLYYAEVCNEIDPSNPDIITYLDKIRERAGIPGYAELAASGKKNIIGNQELQREAIYRERIIEMLGEGNYYFDMHRWMRAGWSQDANGNWLQKDNEDKSIPRYGMDKDSPAVLEFKSTQAREAKTFSDAIGTGSFYNRIVIDRYPWSKAMLLYPVPYNEMQKSLLTVQNPLWN